MTRYVKTDYDGCEYITAGKVYEADTWGELSKRDPHAAIFWVDDDNGQARPMFLRGEEKIRFHGWIECTADGTPLSEVDAAKPNTDANWQALTSDVMEAFGEAFQEQPDYLDKRLAEVIAEHLNQKGYVRVEYEEGE